MIDAVKELSKVIGLRCWGVWLGYGSNLTINWGEVGKKKDMKHPIGEFQLWIRDALWRIESNGTPVIGSEDDAESIKEKISILEERMIVGVSIGACHDIAIELEGGIRLATFCVVTEEESESWCFFVEGYHVITSVSGQNIVFEEQGQNTQAE